MARGKPDLEPYLTAAQRLGVDPARCVVIEDSPSGVAAGEAAGCAMVAVAAVPGVLFAPAARRLVLPPLAQVATRELRALIAC